MGYFQVRYASRVVIYERKMFIRLATVGCLVLKVMEFSTELKEIKARICPIVLQELSILIRSQGNILLIRAFISSSVTRLSDLLDFGQLFKAFGNN